jgi:hypothetical protein
MSQHLSHNDITVWQKLVEQHKAFALALKEFFAEGVDRVALMKDGLRSQDRATAIYLLTYLKVSELEGLWPELIYLASFSHGAIKTIRDAILSLPQEWVLARIEEAVEPLLQQGTYDEYRRFLELYIDLDHELALKLALRAVEHSDFDIREAGEDTLKKLKG